MSPRPIAREKHCLAAETAVPNGAMRTLAVVLLGILLGNGSPYAAEVSPTPVSKGREGMVLVPAGEFQMGIRDDHPDLFEHERQSETPRHPVTLKAFWIDKTEVTQKQIETMISGRERDSRSSCDDCPATNVSWHEAKAYCEAQNKRLPTEAEWEKAAKGGSEERPEPFADYAWFNGNSIQSTKPVGQKKPNGYGIHDMFGNVREWTADWFDPDWYEKSTKSDPKGPETGQRKVERGGAFFLPKRSVTATIRYNHPPHFRLYFLGFRCAADA